MDNFWAGAVPVIWTIAGTAFVTLCGFAAKKLHGFTTEHTANNQVAAEHGQLKEDVANLKGGVRTILKQMMVQEHKRLVHQHYATPDEKDHFEEMHTAYSAMDGNGTGDALYSDVMQMYSIAPSEREEARQ